MGKVIINKDFWVNTLPAAAGTSVRGEPGDGLQRLGTLAHGAKVHGVMIYQGDDLVSPDDDWIEINMPAEGFTPISIPMPVPNRGIFVKRKFLRETDPVVVPVPVVYLTDKERLQVLECVYNGCTADELYDAVASIIKARQA